MKSHKNRTRVGKRRTKSLWLLAGFGVLAVSLIAYGRVFRSQMAAAPEPVGASPGDPVKFTDAHRQAAEFIAYDRSIDLTREQKKVMDEALTTIPAPCCAKYSIATCCCPCNLAKATWGLSKFLIANQHYDARQVKATVNEWLQFTNPSGYTGDACFTGGCARSFSKNGCGGMDEHHIQ